MENSHPGNAATFILSLIESYTFKKRCFFSYEFCTIFHDNNYIE